jgi:hypothetical protein
MKVALKCICRNFAGKTYALNYAGFKHAEIETSSSDRDDGLACYLLVRWALKALHSMRGSIEDS